MEDCQFCRIVAEEVPAHVLYDGAETVAFLDQNPAVEGHTLVVPRRHVEDLLLSAEETATAVVRTARAVATAMAETIDPDGFSVFHTSGGLVGNVEHAHLHLLPRFEDDDVRLALPRERLFERNATRLVETITNDR